VKTVTLFRHQEDGVNKGISILLKKRGLGIFFDPGLGKTLTSLTIADYLIEENIIDKFIVVCPKTLYGTWQDQILEHTDYGKAFEYMGDKVGQKGYNDRLSKVSERIILTNYEAYRSPKLEFVSLLDEILPRSIVILDESTKIKNPTSQQSKGIKKYLSKAWGKIIMTGTEITKSPLDLYNQFETLRLGFWGERSWFTFKQRYAITEPLYLPGGKTTQKIIGFQRIHKLQALVEPWIVRAKKEDCLDLPAKILQNIPVELDPKEWKVYQDLKKRLISILDSGEVISVDQKIALFMRFRTITGGWADTTNMVAMPPFTPSKLRVITDMVDDDDKQAIIWASFTHEIIMIEKELKSYGKCVTYYGGRSQEDRKNDFDDFVSGKARFFIANPGTGALGLNLQHCPLQYFYSLPTKSEDFIQALDRSHRIGSKSDVVYRFLLGEFRGQHSIDWRVKALLDQSVDLLHAFQTREIRELISFI